MTGIENTMKLDNPLNLNFNQPETQSTHLILKAGSDGQNQQIDELRKELQAKNRQIEAKDQEISELKIKNRQLQQENQETQERQKLMDEELKKAEAQTELIMELMSDQEKDRSE